MTFEEWWRIYSEREFRNMSERSETIVAIKRVALAAWTTGNQAGFAEGFNRRLNGGP